MYRHLSVILTVIFLALVTRPAQAAFATVLYLTNEMNNGSTALLSSGYTGFSMPQVEMTITATLFLEDNLIPWAGKTVNFDVVLAEGHTVKGITIVGSASGTTNAEGQCKVVVKGDGTAPTDSHPVFVRARFVNGNTTYQEFVLIYLSRANSTDTTAPPIWHSALTSPDNPIKWKYGIADMFASYALGSLDDYNSPGHISFVQDNASPHFIFWEEYYSGSWFGRTEQIGTTNTYHVMFNLAQLHGLRDPDWYAFSTITPLGWRNEGYKRELANHEMGHALLYEHATGSHRKSLMALAGISFWEWETKFPRTDSDWPTLYAYYP